MKHILSILLLSLPIQSNAQDFPLVTVANSQVRELRSNNVGVTYKLYIKLPAKFDPKREYDVIFMLDPEYSFAIAANVTDHLIQRNDLPDVVIVGIGYVIDNYRVNRTRDYTPTKSLISPYGAEVQENSGGGENFYRFISTELIPYIDKTFGKAKSRTLCGHSYGGLFSAWMLFAKAGTFDRHIILSPSLWYDGKKLMKAIEGNPNGVKVLKAKAYMASGDSEDPVMADDLKYLDGILKKIEAPNFSFRIEILENENHNTIFPRAFSNGLRYTFGVR